jgi:hypothetical protein
VLRDLQLEDIGPAATMSFEFGERLNVFTGDNGLGKSFVLDLVWWILTGTWASRPAVPSGPSPNIHYRTLSEVKGTATFSVTDQEWQRTGIGIQEWPVVYLSTDRFAVFYPCRNDAFRFGWDEL